MLTPETMDVPWQLEPVAVEVCRRLDCDPYHWESHSNGGEPLWMRIAREIKKASIINGVLREMAP